MNPPTRNPEAPFFSWQYLSYRAFLKRWHAEWSPVLEELAPKMYQRILDATGEGTEQGVPLEDQPRSIAHLRDKDAPAYYKACFNRRGPVLPVETRGDPPDDCKPFRIDTWRRLPEDFTATSAGQKLTVALVYYGTGVDRAEKGKPKGHYVAVAYWPEAVVVGVWRVPDNSPGRIFVHARTKRYAYTEHGWPDTTVVSTWFVDQPSIVEGEQRVWTSAEGKEVEARAVRVYRAKRSIVLEAALTGKSHTIPISGLSEQDQLHIEREYGVTRE